MRNPNPRRTLLPVKPSIYPASPSDHHLGAVLDPSNPNITQSSYSGFLGELEASDSQLDYNLCYFLLISSPAPYLLVTGIGNQDSLKQRRPPRQILQDLCGEKESNLPLTSPH
ncbi:hypothetical protein MJO29_015709 [Puccinia striiformis f. sp. tritici]|nr:hypothetical protein MJO29_015709 [Puccinia striiformis f. sp. tritici]